MIQLNMEQRTSLDLNGLQELISKVFTDEDANGNNGEEYYINGGTFDSMLKKLVKEWSKSCVSEEEIVSKAFVEYAYFCRSYYREMDYDFKKNAQGKIILLAFVGYTKY